MVMCPLLSQTSPIFIPKASPSFKLQILIQIVRPATTSCRLFPRGPKCQQETLPPQSELRQNKQHRLCELCGRRSLTERSNCVIGKHHPEGTTPQICFFLFTMFLCDICIGGFKTPFKEKPMVLFLILYIQVFLSTNFSRSRSCSRFCFKVPLSFS